MRRVPGCEDERGRGGKEGRRQVTRLMELRERNAGSREGQGRVPGGGDGVGR